MFICLWLSKYIFYLLLPFYLSTTILFLVLNCFRISLYVHRITFSMYLVSRLIFPHPSYSAHLSAFKVLHSRWSCIGILNHLVKFQLIMKFSSKQQLWKWAGHVTAKIRVKLSCKVFDRKINHWFSFLSVCLELIIICCPTHNHEMRY